MRRAWPLLALLAALAAAAAAISLLGGENGPEGYELEVAVGFNNNAVTDGLATPAQSAELLARAGAEVDRVQIRWATLEPRPGEYDFGVYDEIYEADLQRGIQPLFIFSYAPAWAAGEDAPCDARVPSCHLPPAPEHYDDAARTAAVIAERYPEAAAIEIWNEPNTSYFWRPRPDPAAYAELLAVSFRAIKRAAPATTVAGVSTASGEGASSMRDHEFVRGVLGAGAGESMDVLSVHAYLSAGDLTGASAVATIEAIEAVQREMGTRLPVWVTETGVSATGPGAVTESQQASALAQLTARLDAVEAVEMVLVHTLIRRPTAPDDPEGGFGVLGPDHVPGEAFCALRRVWTGAECQPAP